MRLETYFIILFINNFLLRLTDHAIKHFTLGLNELIQFKCILHQPVLMAIFFETTKEKFEIKLLNIPTLILILILGCVP